METNLLLVLLPPHETAARLEKAQSALCASWPFAEAWPPFIPIARLSALPPASTLLQAKTIVWPRLDVPIPWELRVDESGCLGIRIDGIAWNGYREGLLGTLGPWLAGPDAPRARQLPELSPNLVLAPGPEDGAAVPLPQERLVINAPFLAALEFSSSDAAATGECLEWRLLASHRVCKAR
jgi:hypothetical protein